MNRYDIILIGAGHNGLTAAALLAKAGKNVLVLEKRASLGGACVGNDNTPSLAPLPSGMLRPDIIRTLGLERFGLQPNPAPTDLISLLAGSRQLTLSADTAKTVASIAPFSRADAQKWPEFLRFMEKAAAFLESAYNTPIPRLPHFPPAEGLPLAQLALQLRRLGAKDMHNIIRLLPMSAKEFLDEWFESDELKAALATLGIHNTNLGVMSAGSAYNLLHQYLIRGGGWGQPASDLRQAIAALESAAKSYGAEIRTNAEVERITIENYHVTGVMLASGEHIPAATVLSSADPKTTFLRLVTPHALDPEFAWQVKNIKMRGVTAKLQLYINPSADSFPSAKDPSVHPFPSVENIRSSVTHPLATSAENATYIIAPSLNYLEQAYDSAKYGHISERPYLEITSSVHPFPSVEGPSVHPFPSAKGPSAHPFPSAKGPSVHPFSSVEDPSVHPFSSAEGPSAHPFSSVEDPSVHPFSSAEDPSVHPFPSVDGPSVINIHFQYAPYFLKNSTWNLERETLHQNTRNTLQNIVPQLPITNLHFLTPLDLETTFSLSEGDPHHGQLMLDQFFFMRPIPGYASQKTPIAGLYLCGSGVHGGGGVSGIPGRNAAKLLTNA